MRTHSTAPVAYSYIRFSSAEQAKGDSLRRQVEMAEAYCKRRGWTLDESLSLRDLGVSAFKGDNALVGNLRQFLDAVSRGTILPGSVLIVESVDRISRQGIDQGYEICKRILKAGVHIVTLSPERDFGPDAVKSLSKGALELQLILERAAEESERKSERVGAAWSRKKQAARNGVVMGDRVPAWIRNDGGTLVLIPQAAKAVRYVFRLAASGYSIVSIIKKLEAEKVPAIGHSGRWTRAYLAILLHDERVRGKYQPRTQDDDGKVILDGEAIPDYYPALIDEEEWYRARAGADERKRNHGRRGKIQVNIFAGLMKHARDGDSYIMTQRLSRYKGKLVRKYSVLINSEGDHGRARIHALPYSGIEDAVLKRLREIDPTEIRNGDAPPDDSAILSAKLVEVESEIAEASAYMDANGFSPAIGKRITDLEARQKEIGGQLAIARQKAVYPLSECWGETQSLAKALATAPDQHDARLRLRSALRRIVASIWVLIVPRGNDRLCALQIWFADEKRRRDYLVLYRPGNPQREATWSEPLSLASITPATLDLRVRKDAAQFEQLLTDIDLDLLVAAMEEANGKR